MSNFDGFPADALDFYAQVKQNNDRDWFAENKARFKSQVQEPGQDFVVAFGTAAQALSSGIRFDTSLNGSGSMMRIYRDVRFSKDKSPYKTYQGFGFWEGKSKKEPSSGIYLGFSDDGGAMHVGLHMFSKEYLSAYRDAVDDQREGEALAAALNKAKKQGYTIHGEQLKKVPRGYDAEHPRGDLLKYKSLYVNAENIGPEIWSSSKLVPTLTKHFKALLPVHNWLVAVGAKV
jgi:uncharacterized protein (TIGR02453 family)